MLRLLVLLGVPLLSGQPEKTITHADYAELRAAYQDGRHRESVGQLLAASPVELGALNDDLAGMLAIERPDERRQLVTAVQLHAEAARRAADAMHRDFYLDEAFDLASALPDEERDELRKLTVLALSHSLLRRYRVQDALQLLAAGVERYPEGVALQFALGTVAELSGWIDDSEERLRTAESAYDRVLAARPDDARAALRRGRVLLLLGERREEGAAAIAASLERVDEAERFGGLMTLGRYHASREELATALEHYERALTLDPACQAAAVATSATLRRMGESERATRVVETGAGYDDPFAPPDRWVEYRLGDALRENEFWDALRRLTP